MSAFLYGVALQWRLDIRSKTLLITCYVVPLLFFAVMGGIFTAVNPIAKDTLIQSMSIMGISMGALIGLPPTLVETYGSDLKKMYQANGVPLYLGVVTAFLSAFLHLLLMCGIIYVSAPLAFQASLPKQPGLFLAGLAIFTAISLSVGCCLGLLVKNQAKLTMLSQLFFLPSIMLSGIMFPSDLLPAPFAAAGMIFPASWGFRLMADGGFVLENLWPLALILVAAVLLCSYLLKKIRTQ